MTAYEVMTPDSNNNTLVIFSDFEEETFQPVKVITLRPDVRVVSAAADHVRRSSAAGGGISSVVSGGGYGSGNNSGVTRPCGDVDGGNDSGDGGESLRKAARKCVNLHSVDIIPTKSCKYTLSSNGKQK